MKVEVAYAGPTRQLIVGLELNSQGTVQDAIDSAFQDTEFALLCEHDGIDVSTTTVGVFGEVSERNRQLLAGDRVELYRPLQVDPKEARRLRQRSGS